MRQAAVLALACLLIRPVTAQDAADPEALRSLLKDLTPPEHWVYNDLQQAIERAQLSGKPLMVVFR